MVGHRNRSGGSVLLARGLRQKIFRPFRADPLLFGAIVFRSGSNSGRSTCIYSARLRSRTRSCLRYK